MKISKFLLTVFIVTACAVAYIHQQTQILLASYKLQENEFSYGYLLDCQQELLYNVAEIQSPQCLQQKLVMKNISMDRLGQVIRIVKADALPSDTTTQKNSGGFFGFLTSQAQAQALK